MKLKNRQYCLNSSFNPLAATTLRWTSGVHTNSPGSPSRKCQVTWNDDQFFVHSDYSQCELVVLAFLSKDPDMIKAFRDRKDMHKFVASLVYKKPYDDITSDERRAAKGCSFAICYGQSISNLAKASFDGDVERAQEAFDSFFDAFPTIKTWMDSMISQAKEKGYITSVLGNQIVIEMQGNDVGSVERTAVNYPIQSLASTIAGVSFYELAKYCMDKGIKYTPLSFTHDANDSIMPVKGIFELLDLLEYKLQDEVYEKSGIPMVIDFELGIDAYGLCEFKFSKVGDIYECEIEGEQEYVDKVISRLSRHYTVNENTLSHEEEKYESYHAMFTTGTALSDKWGKTINYVTHNIKLVNKEKQ